MRVLAVTHISYLGLGVSLHSGTREVVTVHSSEEMELYRDREFDAAVVVLGTTELGLEMVRSVRAEFGDLPCLVLGVEPPSEELDAVAYLEPPFTLERIEEVLLDAFGLAAPPPEPEEEEEEEASNGARPRRFGLSMFTRSSSRGSAEKEAREPARASPDVPAPSPPAEEAAPTEPSEPPAPVREPQPRAVEEQADEPEPPLLEEKVQAEPPVDAEAEEVRPPFLSSDKADGGEGTALSPIEDELDEHDRLFPPRAVPEDGASEAGPAEAEWEILEPEQEPVVAEPYVDLSFEDEAEQPDVNGAGPKPTDEIEPPTPEPDPDPEAAEPEPAPELVPELEVETPGSEPFVDLTVDEENHRERSADDEVALAWGEDAGSPRDREREAREFEGGMEPFDESTEEVPESFEPSDEAPDEAQEEKLEGEAEEPAVLERDVMGAGPEPAVEDQVEPPAPEPEPEPEPEEDALGPELEPEPEREATALEPEPAPEPVPEPEEETPGSEPFVDLTVDEENHRERSAHDEVALAWEEDAGSPRDREREAREFEGDMEPFDESTEDAPESFEPSEDQVEPPAPEAEPEPEREPEPETVEETAGAEPVVEPTSDETTEEEGEGAAPASHEASEEAQEETLDEEPEPEPEPEPEAASVSEVPSDSRPSGRPRAKSRETLRDKLRRRRTAHEAQTQEARLDVQQQPARREPESDLERAVDNCDLIQRILDEDPALLSRAAVAERFLEDVESRVAVGVMIVWAPDGMGSYDALSVRGAPEVIASRKLPGDQPVLQAASEGEGLRRVREAPLPDDLADLPALLGDSVLAVPLRAGDDTVAVVIHAGVRLNDGHLETLRTVAAEHAALLALATHLEVFEIRRQAFRETAT